MLRDLKAEHLYRIDGELYKVNKNKDVCFVGDVYYDGRYKCFCKIETESDVEDIWFIAPEFRAFLDKV